MENQCLCLFLCLCLCPLPCVFDVTPVPPVPISRGRTVIFDIVEYIIMEWTSRMKPEYARSMLIPKNKKKSVAGQFAAVKYSSETYCWTQRLNREDTLSRSIVFVHAKSGLTVLKHTEGYLILPLRWNAEAELVTFEVIS